VILPLVMTRSDDQHCVVGHFMTAVGRAGRLVQAQRRLSLWPPCHGDRTSIRVVDVATNAEVLMTAFASGWGKGKPPALDGALHPEAELIVPASMPWRRQDCRASPHQGYDAQRYRGRNGQRLDLRVRIGRSSAGTCLRGYGNSSGCRELMSFAVRPPSRPEWPPPVFTVSTTSL
jgi:hypothetical protein